MRAAARLQGRRRQSGVTLVELMIALVLSMVVLLAVSSLFLANKRSYSTQDEGARMQEDARTLISILSRDLRQAGYRDVTKGVSFNTPIVKGSNTASGAPGASDSFELRYFGSGSGTAAGQGDGSVVNCYGESVPATHMQVTRYYVANDASSGEPALYCETPGRAARKLIDGIESLQVLVGEDTQGSGGAGRFAPFETKAPAEPRAIWVGFVQRSRSLGHPAPDNPKFNLFGTAYAPADTAPTSDAGAVFEAPADGRLRRQHDFVVGLRNFLD